MAFRPNVRGHGLQSPDQSQPGEQQKNVVRDVDLPPGKPLPYRSGIAVMVVVPAFPEGEQGDPEVVAASDHSGSTAKIKKMVESSSPGSKWVVGTEYNMVNRLRMQNRDKIVEPLSKSVCVNMSKNRRRDLLEVLLAIRGGDYSSQILLPPDVVKGAKKAIRRMLEQ